MMDPHERLSRLLGGAALARLRARLRSRYQRGRGDGAVTLGNLDAPERDALAGLLGRRPNDAASIRFDVAEVDARLRGAGLAGSLREALELLDGPLVDLVAARAQEERQWLALQAWPTESRLSAFLGSARGLGLLKRVAAANVAAATRLVEQAQAVLAKLPCAATPRSHLAAQLLGDAHALDSGRPVATIVLAVLRQGRAEGEQPEQDESVRDVWASAGVLVNELARPALFLNLPTRAAVCGASGEPSYLSLRALLGRPPEWEVRGRDVFVCENPNLLAIAADSLGEHCAPLACTDGMPAAAQRALLVQLAAAGAHLRYHGDFDWPGIAIGNFVTEQFGASPWRFGAEDYRAAVDTNEEATRALNMAPVDARWDAELAPAMRAYGRAIDEEALVRMLLPDLDTRLQKTTC